MPIKCKQSHQKTRDPFWLLFEFGNHRYWRCGITITLRTWNLFSRRCFPNIQLEPTFKIHVIESWYIWRSWSTIYNYIIILLVVSIPSKNLFVLFDTWNKFSYSYLIVLLPALLNRSRSLSQKIRSLITSTECWLNLVTVTIRCILVGRMFHEFKTNITGLLMTLSVYDHACNMSRRPHLWR